MKMMMNGVWLVLLFVTMCSGIGAAQEADLGRRVAAAARQQIGVTTAYDPGYVALGYPGGDVPASTGVCSDVVVRALRRVGVDLQKEVHEDMRAHFGAYPQKWGLKAPDRNIDHRRVANLMRYFERRHITVSADLEVREKYRPGDIVAWDLGRGVLHIGIVSGQTSGGTPLIIHNIGEGAKEEDLLLKYKVIGHYRLQKADQHRAGSPSGTMQRP
jgi:uncharacterized protein YijF (DUF1287 family)